MTTYADDDRPTHITIDGDPRPPLPCCSRSGQELCAWDDDTREECTCDCHESEDCPEDGPPEGLPCLFHKRNPDGTRMMS